MRKKTKTQETKASKIKILENSKFKKALRIFRIVRNVIFGILLAALVCLVLTILIARTNGETPTIFGYTVYRVVSPSMTPYLQVGDIILCKECDPMDLKAGDIITYNGNSGQFEGKRVTHRVVKEPYLNPDDDKYYLLTKGDDNPIEDTPIEISQVTGKYVKKIDILRQIYDFFLTPWGLLTIIGLIILAFFNEIINLIKAVKSRGESDEDIQEVIERVQKDMADDENEKAEKLKRKEEKKKRKEKKKLKDKTEEAKEEANEEAKKETEEEKEND